jgi:hypothetical protein
MEWVWRLPLFLLLVVPDSHGAHELSCLSITNWLDRIDSNGNRKADEDGPTPSKFNRLSVGIEDVFKRGDTDQYRVGGELHGCPITVNGIVLTKVHPSTGKKTTKALKGWLHITFTLRKRSYGNKLMTPDSFFAFSTR